MRLPYKHVQMVLSIGVLLFIIYHAATHLDDKIGGAIVLMCAKEVIYLIKHVDERNSYRALQDESTSHKE